MRNIAVVDRALLVLLASGAPVIAVAAPAEAKSTSSIERTEDNLAAAGFVVKPANSPERAEMLMRLPPNTFVQRVDGDEVT